MFKIFFNIMLDLLATLVQVVVFPINAVISSTLPDISSRISSVINGFTTITNTLGWAIGLIPTPILTTLSFILIVEIAKFTIFRSTHLVIKVWNLFQKIKFW